MNPEAHQQAIIQEIQSKQLIPKWWKPKSSRDLIYDFFAHSLKQIPKENENIEIEVRLGRSDFVQRSKGADANVYGKVLRDLSIQTPLIVGSNHPLIQNKLKMLSTSSLNEIKHFFDPKIRETMFMSRLEFIQKSKQFSEKRLDFSIDFIPESRDRNNDLGRFTMDIENGTF